MRLRLHPGRGPEATRTVRRSQGMITQRSGKVAYDSAANHSAPGAAQRISSRVPRLFRSLDQGAVVAITDPTRPSPQRRPCHHQAIRDFLREEVEGQEGLAPYRNRIVAVSGSGDLEEPSRQRAVQGFAPVSMEAPAGQDADLYDLMIATSAEAAQVPLRRARSIGRRSARRSRRTGTALPSCRGIA